MDPPVSRIGWNDQKIMQTRHELNQAKNIMKANVQKIMERQSKLDDLVERAQKLEIAANEYEKCAVQVHRQMQWKIVAIRYGVVAASMVFAITGLLYSLG
ncbi:unnamed protein product [Caenorhabditis bovis]|uniref:V-SNARE coiled-coil homology domain-containing protein n=1 Tax=Caenorhabditis bovis TaxID=2654633 RepID=A0A8S1ER28_9PELO|nr:unnamed protein product [Caenorhabditis bovis]